MATDLRFRWRLRRTALVTGLVLALSAVAAAPVLASASEEQQGARLLQSLQAGKTSCQRLSPNSFELIGEYVMGRMLGSTATHEAMNRQMTSMMGGSGEARAHTFMGRRFAGCATGSTPAVFATMMGMMGGYANGNGNGNGSGSGMMGGSGVRGPGHNGGSGDNDWGTGMVVMIGLLMAAVVGALAVWRPWQRSQVQTPLDLLGKRYASGEIDGEEYERRRQALGGED